MTTIEILKQARDALEEMTRHFNQARLHGSTLADSSVRGNAHKVRDAINQHIKELESSRPNAWKEAVLDQLAAHSIDAPVNEPPASILARIINTAVLMAKDPAINAEPVSEPKDANCDLVICPNCVHQFRAIPVNVQKLMLDAGFEPPFTAAPQSAVPLTDARVAEIVDACTTADHGYDIWCNGKQVARMVEAAHGIGERQ